jgi:hypothetical protein
MNFLVLLSVKMMGSAEPHAIGHDELTSLIVRSSSARRHGQTYGSPASCQNFAQEGEQAAETFSAGALGPRQSSMVA